MQPPIAHAANTHADEAQADEVGLVVGRERPALKESLRDVTPPLVVRPATGDLFDVAQQPRPKKLWIAVHLPWIPLEALQTGPIAQRTQAASQPIAVVELVSRAQYVVAADQVARQGGVRPGMTLAAALALVPGLEAKPRDARREQVLLEQLATRMQRFTSRVSIVPPDGLVLEVKGSLKLFGGTKTLGRAVIAASLDAGARPVIALAPTPLAAMAGARAGKTFIVTDGAKLVGQLAALPLAVLRWPMEIIDRLAKIGVGSIGEALRLPRAGFARRFGKEQLAALDRLAGRAPDLRKEFHARERFRKRRDLTYDLEHHEGVLEVLEPMLQELEKFLRGRQSGITALECRLKHRHAPSTRCVLKLAAPEVDAQRLKALFAERLLTLVLPEPVRACELRSGDIVSRASHANSLWRPGEHGGGVGGEATAFIELLRARLGADAVHSLRAFADHRPEAAWRVVDPSVAGRDVAAGVACISWPAFRRPLWLLPQPQPLIERDSLPCYRGPLRLTGESERIETGWWDGKDIMRDYYCALDVRGVKLWIFRECRAPHAWYLHGFFG